MQYTQGCVVIRFAVVILSAHTDSYDYIILDYGIDTELIVWLPQCQWRIPDIDNSTSTTP